MAANQSNRKQTPEIPFRSLRGHYIMGFSQGLLLTNGLYFFVEDWGKGERRFFCLFFLMCIVSSFYFSWRSRKNVYAQLKELEDELKSREKDAYAPTV